MPRNSSFLNMNSKSVNICNVDNTHGRKVSVCSGGGKRRLVKSPEAFQLLDQFLQPADADNCSVSDLAVGKEMGS